VVCLAVHCWMIAVVVRSAEKRLAIARALSEVCLQS
jgi:hypothetical protein